ncbi:hypothetical protein [Streptomyces tsukubensis]|uniref:Sortase n=1 Tax=Streptomyces tsukubensis TaxID=83656 RepID=A0A1V4ABW6_9ACTN|nr:hypothetical protein [Streptomyces tsukubensis]OON80894.1 hypothetical protein B1H18_11005 [Streptomyces tsukubensis]QFR93459.1 hypothetical protein GBW32_10660 [Streptomyces tsukubensis]
MPTARLLTGTALAAAAAGLTVVPAYAGAEEPSGSAARQGALQMSPSTVVPGATVLVNTAACGSRATATGDAAAVGSGSFALAPSTRPEDARGKFRVPPSAQPGTYEIVAKCSDGTSVAGDLMVTLQGAQGAQGAAADVAPPMAPRGHVRTGVGGALGTDPVRTAAGVAALAVAAAGGTWLLHRRARGDRI